MRVRALQNIWHNAAAHAAGEAFDVSDALAEQLRQVGLVDIVEEPKPQPAEPSKPDAAEPVEPPPAKRSEPRKKAKK